MSDFKESIFKLISILTQISDDEACSTKISYTYDNCDSEDYKNGIIRLKSIEFSYRK